MKDANTLAVDRYLSEQEAWQTFCEKNEARVIADIEAERTQWVFEDIEAVIGNQVSQFKKAVAQDDWVEVQKILDSGIKAPAGKVTEVLEEKFNEC